MSEEAAGGGEATATAEAGENIAQESKGPEEQQSQEPNDDMPIEVKYRGYEPGEGGVYGKTEWSPSYKEVHSGDAMKPEYVAKAQGNWKAKSVRNGNGKLSTWAEKMIGKTAAASSDFNGDGDFGKFPDGSDKTNAFIHSNNESLERIVMEMKDEYSPGERSSVIEWLKNKLHLAGDMVENASNNTLGYLIARRHNTEVLGKLRAGELKGQKVYIVAHGDFQNAGGPLGYLRMGKEQGHNVISLDWNFKDMKAGSQQLYDLAREITEHTGIAPNILGHSSGGNLAMYTAIDRPDFYHYTDRIVLSNTPMAGLNTKLPSHYLMKAVGFPVLDRDDPSTEEGARLADFINGYHRQPIQTVTHIGNTGHLVNPRWEGDELLAVPDAFTPRDSGHTVIERGENHFSGANGGSEAAYRALVDERQFGRLDDINNRLGKLHYELDNYSPNAFEENKRVSRVKYHPDMSLN
jgi:pimeloyl-ACP methyl ester carboxylesterase